VRSAFAQFTPFSQTDVNRRFHALTLCAGWRFCDGYQFVQFTKAKNEIKIPDQAELERGTPAPGASIGMKSKSGRPYDENICVR
jgi:hypothetical protein